MKKITSYVNFRDYGDEAIRCKSIPHAIEVVTEMQNQIERVWVIGGSSVYKVFYIRCIVTDKLMSQMWHFQELNLFFSHAFCN